MSKGKSFHKKIKRKKISLNKHNKNNSIKTDLIIDIKNSIFSFKNLKGHDKDDILKLNKIKKSKIFKKIEKSQIKYTKINYISSNKISFECKKISHIPPELIDKNKKHKFFLRLLEYNKKKFLLIGYTDNILIYEIINDNLYYISSFFEQNVEEKISKIILLNENYLTNKIQFFIIIKNKGLLYEFDLKDYKFKTLNENIILFKIEDYSKNYRFKYINNNKLIIYNDYNAIIYNIINNIYKQLQLNLDEYENIHICQKLINDLFIINSDKKLYIIDSLSESLLYKINTELHFYWIKILLLKNKQFLLYSNSDIDIYDFDYITKTEYPKLNGKLKLNNIKYIQKIKQITNEDLIISYNFYNLLIYDLKKKLTKYQIINSNPQGNYLNHYYIILEEIEPNIIAIKKNLYQLNFFNAIKGELLGYFKEEEYIIKAFKQIRLNSIGIFNNENNDKKKFYFILTDKNVFILYK